MLLRRAPQVQTTETVAPCARRAAVLPSAAASATETAPRPGAEAVAEPLARQLARAVSNRWLCGSAADTAMLQRATATITTPASETRQVDYEDRHFNKGADGTAHWGRMQDGEEVVVKVASAEGEEALQGEIAALRDLGGHQNIVPIVGWSNSVLVLAKAKGSLVSNNGEHLVGTSFTQRMKMVQQILAGLTHMHSHDWSHGDLNLKNILVFADRVTLADLGAALKPETPNRLPAWAVGLEPPDERTPEERRTRRSLTDRAAMTQAIYNIVIGSLSDARIPKPEEVRTAVAQSVVPEGKRDAFVDLIEKHRAGAHDLGTLQADVAALASSPGLALVGQ